VVKAGTRIGLALQPYGGSYDPPTVDDPGVVSELSHHGGYPASTAAVAEFRAKEHGSAQISSQTDMACLHATPACLPPQFEFRVTISVR
jgi:hypothetical protein